MCAALQLPCHPLSSFTDITAEVKLKDAVFCPQSNSPLYSAIKFTAFSELLLCLLFFHQN